MNGELQERVHTTIDKGTHDELLAHCSRHGVRKADFIRRAITEALKAARLKDMQHHYPPDVPL